MTTTRTESAVLDLTYGASTQTPGVIDLSVTPHILLTGRPAAGKAEAAKTFAYIASTCGVHILDFLQWSTLAEDGLKYRLRGEGSRRQAILEAHGVSAWTELPEEVADSFYPVLMVIDDVRPSGGAKKFSAAEIRTLESINNIAKEAVDIHLIITTTEDLGNTAAATTILSDPSWARVTLTGRPSATGRSTGQLEIAGAVTDIIAPPYANDLAIANVEAAREVFLEAKAARKAAREIEEAAQAALSETVVMAVLSKACSVSTIQPATGVSRALIYQWMPKNRPDLSDRPSMMDQREEEFEMEAHTLVYNWMSPGRKFGDDGKKNVYRRPKPATS